MKNKKILIFVFTLMVFLPNLVSAKEIKVYLNSNVSYTDIDNDNTINVGDKVQIGTEGFYIVQVDDDGYKMLSEKNIDLSTLLQSDSAGTIHYSGSTYDGSNVNSYSVNYVTQLNNTYGTQATSNKLSKYILKELECSDGKCFTAVWPYTEYTYVGDKYSWLVDRDYWVYANNNSAHTTFAGRVIDGVYDEGQSGYYGVRPVIKIPKEIFNTVTVNASNGDADIEVDSSRNVTIIPNPDTGYELDKIVVVDSNGDNVEVSNNTFTMPNDNVIMTVTYKKIIYTVTDKESNNGSYKIDTEGSSYGDKVTVIPTPDTGYELDKIVVLDSNNNNVEVSNNAFTMPSDDVSINVTYKPIQYKFISGENSDYKGTDMVFVLNGEYSLFDSVYINGKLLDASNYTVKKGSTIITLNNSYLETLASNTYTLQVNYKNGTNVTTNFKIENVEEVIENPKTYDGILSSVVLGLVSLIGLFGSVFYLKKRNN
jgi:hypothetical protein